MSDKIKNYHYRFLNNGCLCCLFLFFVYPPHAHASDPSGLFLPVMIFATMAGISAFAVSLGLIAKFEKKHIRVLLSGFSFGLFLAPIGVNQGVPMLNIVQLMPFVGGKGIVAALPYAIAYSLLAYIIHFLSSKLNREPPSGG